MVFPRPPDQFYGWIQSLMEKITPKIRILLKAEGPKPHVESLARSYSSCSAALLAVARQDVAICCRDASPSATTKSHGLQLGRVRTAAGAGAFEGLFKHRTEGDERVRAGRVAAVTLAASQQHHLGVTLVDGMRDGLDKVVPHTSLRVGVSQVRVFGFVAAGRLDQAQKWTAHEDQ